MSKSTLFMRTLASIGLVALVVGGGLTAASAMASSPAGAPLVLKTVSTQQLRSVGIILTGTTRTPTISKHTAVVTALKEFPGTKALELALGMVNQVSSAHQYFAWIVSAWPPPPPVGRKSAVSGGERRSSFLVIFIDASTGKFISAVSQSPKPPANPCDEPFRSFPNPLQRIYRLVHGRWIRPHTHYNRADGQYLPAIYTGDAVRFTLTVRPGKCVKVASVHMRVLPAHWNSRGEVQSHFCSCMWPGPRVTGHRIKPGVWDFVRQMHFERRPASHVVLLAWSILTTDGSSYGIPQIVRVYTPLPR